MLIKKSDAHRIETSEDCAIWEYNFPSKNFSYATALINGRYPKEKRAVNLECEEVYFVMSGSGIVHSESGDFYIDPGDVYFFKPGEIFWVEGKNLALALINAPRWSADQHKIVE